MPAHKQRRLEEKVKNRAAFLVDLRFVSMNTSGRSGIREIAAALGVSIGTVDRALHRRSGISPATCERVLKMAARLNYTPNMAAQHLKRPRELKIAAFLPAEIASFFDQVRDGIQAGAARWSGAQLKLTMHTYPRLGTGDVECMEREGWQEYDGVILSPGDPEALGVLLRSAKGKLPAVVYVASDAPRTERVAAVSVDSNVSGGIAAELLGRVLPQRSSVVAITGDRRVQDHAAKLSGYAATLALRYPGIVLLPSIETHESSDEAYRAITALFQDYPDVGGIYVTTADSMPVIRAVRESGRLGKVQIVTTDLSSELAPMIENDCVFASLYQRPFTQGQTAVDILCRHLLQHKRTPVTTPLAPHIILRSNLTLFMTRLEEGA